MLRSQMHTYLPLAARCLAPLGLAALASANLQTMQENAGSSPWLAAIFVGLLAAATATGAAWRLTPIHSYGRSILTLSAASAPAMMAAWTWSPMSGMVIGLTGSAGAPGVTWAALAALLIVPAASATWRATRGESHIVWGSGVAGWILGATLNPWAAVPVATLLIAAGQGSARGPRAARLRISWGFPRVLPLAVTVMATGGIWAAARAAIDPTPWSTGVTVAAAAGGALLARAWSPRGAWWSAPAAAVFALVGAASLSVMPDLLDGVAAQALNSGEVGWLSLPFAAAGGLGGAVIGFAWGRSPARLAPWGVSCGLLLAAVVPMDPGLWLGGLVLALFAALFAGEVLARGVGTVLVLAALAVALVGQSAPDADIARGRWRTLRGDSDRARDIAVRAQQQVLDARVGAEGSWVVRAPIDAWESLGKTNRPTDWPVSADLDGLVVTTGGRRADAERWAGHLGPLLAERAGRVLILGDDLGLVVSALTAHDVGLAHVATPAPASVRAIAELRAATRQAWLDPSIALRPMHPDAAIRSTAERDLIIEIQRAPWRDAMHGSPDPTHLRAVTRALADDGLYLLVVHLDWYPQGGAAAIAGDFSDHFPYVQVWMPPAGGDSLILMGSRVRPPLGRFLSRANPHAPALEALGIASPATAAGFAVANRDGASAWSVGSERASSNRLSPAVVDRPVQHLSALAPHVGAPGEIWDTSGQEALIDDLERGLLSRQTLMNLLGDAARGDLAGVFGAAQDMLAADEAQGSMALASLIGPHLAEANAALRRARAEGPSSAGWKDAARHASTARSLSPRSPEPLLILGEIALAQAAFNGATSHFEAVLALDERNLEAQWGLARVAQARHDPTAAEGHYRAACRDHPRAWQTWHNLGLFLTEIGKLDEAEPPLRKAAGLSQGSQAQPHLALAELYLAQERYTAAMVQAERAVAMDRTGQALYLHGRAMYELGRYDQALDDFRDAVIVSPRLVEARGGIGKVLAIRGEWDAAGDAFRGVLAIDPSNVAARENLRRVEQQRAFQAPENAPGAPRQEAPTP